MGNIMLFQKNRLLLAGLLAFAVLFFTQITVLAYDYGGGWSVVKNVGSAGVQWLNVGNPLVDADVNAGQMPSIATVTPTNVDGTATLNGNISNLGASASTYAYFQWWYDGGAINSTPLQLKTSSGTVSQDITFDPNKTINVRMVAFVDSVTVIGSTIVYDASGGGNSIFKNLIPISVAIVVGLLVLIASGTLNVQVLMIAAIGGTMAYFITAVIISILF